MPLPTTVPHVTVCLRTRPETANCRNGKYVLESVLLIRQLKHHLPQQPLRVPEAPGGGLWNPSESQHRPTRNEGQRWAPSPTGDSRSTFVHLPSELSRRGSMTCLKETQKILGRRYGFCFKMKSQAVLKGGEKWEVLPSS